MNNSFKKVAIATVMTVGVSSLMYAQAPTNANQILQEINTQTDTAAGTLKLIFATIAWIFLGLGIVMIIYSAIVDSQRLKFGIISFLAAALILAVGYGVGLF